MVQTNATAVERVVNALSGLGKTVRPSSGGYVAQCPSHDDHNPSLSVRDAGGKVLLHCQVGCETPDVASALGLTMADLFDEQRHRGKAVVVAEYPYVDEQGTVLFVKERLLPKAFRIKRPDGRGGWSYKLGDAPRVLYRLPEVLAAVQDGRTVYVVEGEKDADRLSALGYVATCNFDGAAKGSQRPKWRGEYGDVLAGADVVIIRDRDEAGEAHAQAILADLARKAKSAVIVESAVEREHADVSDHLNASHGLDELVKVEAGSGGVIATDRDDEEEDAVLPGVPDFPHGLARGPLRELVDWADRDGLPVSFVAVSGEVAAASAAAGRPGLGGKRDLGARLRLTATRTIWPVLWAALIAGSGEGKNPSINAGLAPIVDYFQARMNEWDALREQNPKEPRPQALIQSSVGIESIARWLEKTGGSGLIRNGELASFLKGLGQYKAGGGSDRYDAMDIWSGEPINIERVGDGGSKNAVQIYVPNPRMSIIGGLVTDNVRLLGSESDGLRARFLPVLPSSLVEPNLDGSEPLPSAWTDAMTALLDSGEAREWLLRGEARELAQKAIRAWKDRQRNGADPVVVKTALAKADEQCLRIALVAAESEAPCKGGDVPLWAVEYAIARVEYSLGCWMSLGSDQVMAFTRKDEVLNAGVADLLRAIEARSPGPSGRKYMTRRDIQTSQVAGARNPDLVDQLIRAYLTAYPGSVSVFSDKDHGKFPRARTRNRSTTPEAAGRGPAPVIVYAPLRHAPTTLTRGQRTPGKLLDPTVSARHTDDVRPQEHARQSGTGAHEQSPTIFQQFPSNSFHPTVIATPGQPPTDPGDELGEWSA